MTEMEARKVRIAGGPMGFAVRVSLVLALHVAAASTSSATSLQKFDIAGPEGSGAFGTAVVVLPNGNFVVTDPAFSNSTASAIGAVYVFSPSGALISTLTGSSANDRVGNGGVVVLTNGNYVISSYYWRNDSVSEVGAATWGSGASGVSGVVSARNSLIGDHSGDQVSRAKTD